MNDSLLVRGRESLCDAEGILDRAPHRQRSSLQLFPERHALEKFADQKRCAVVCSDVVDSQNVGVVQRGDGARFLLDTPQPVCVLRQRLRQHLDRHVAPEPRVSCAVHFPHASGAQRRDDLIGPEFRA